MKSINFVSLIFIHFYIFIYAFMFVRSPSMVKYCVMFLSKCFAISEFNGHLKWETRPFWIWYTYSFLDRAKLVKWFRFFSRHFTKMEIPASHKVYLNAIKSLDTCWINRDVNSVNEWLINTLCVVYFFSNALQLHRSAVDLSMTTKICWRQCLQQR